MSTAAVPSRQKNNNREKGRGHIPNRAGYGNANSHRKDGPENETSSVSTTPYTGAYRDSRTALMLCTFLGARTSVKTRNGKRYKGLTTGFSAEGDIALLDAKLESEENLPESNMPGIVIPRERFVVCKAPGVDFKGLAIGSSDFTDAGIASRLNGNAEASMKVLQPWEDDGNEAPTSLMLDENQKGWEPSEMFQVNSDKFNVQSSYSEDLDGYTTPKVAPNTEGYEERERFAAMKAEEIEKSEVYKARIAKELAESSEEAKYASVNDTPNARPFDGHNSGMKPYTIPALREDQNMRSAGRGQGRTSQRQISPYPSSSVNHSQSHTNAHQSVHNSRNYMNNHYHHGPSLPGRNPGPPHQRQQQQSPSPSHGPPIHHHHQQAPHSLHQQHPPSSSSQPPVQPQSSQQPQRSSSATQQLVSSSSKVHSNVPPTVPVQSGPKVSHLQQNPVVSPKGAVPLNNQQQIPVTSSRPPVTQQHVNGETKPNQMEVNALSQKFNKLDASARPEAPSHKVSPPSASSSQTSIPPRVTESTSVLTATVADSTAQPVAGTTTVAVTSPQQIPHDRRSGRGLENNMGEARNKVNQQLQDFSKKFVLENATSSNADPPRTEASETSEDTSNPSSTMSSSSVLPLSSMSPSATSESISSSSEPSAATSSKAPEKSEESTKSSPASTSGIVSKLNPLAKEFTPSVKTPSAGEAQSPSPQQRVSPQVHAHQMMAYASPVYGYVQGLQPAMPTASLPTGVMNLPTQKNRHATVSVGRMSELTAHHVTGQPLLATSPQMFYMPSSPSAGFQVVGMSNAGSRMVTPNSFQIPQTGQPGPIDPANPQAQPQPVFLTGQQHQAMPGPMPAHLTQHPQPAHAQAIPNPSTNPTAQPTHVPNPAPSPVQHQPQQQTAQQYGGQPMSHISQGPPQSANPQPSHFPPMSLHHGPTMPRTSMAAQHGMTQSGHPSVSISYSLSTPHSYHNASPGHHTLTPAAQPQTSQNSNHNSGQQPHFVVMPHTNPHQPMQQQHPGQAYTATGIQFQSGHNIVQGPSQMPPSHTPNPSQGAHPIYHPGMQAMPPGIQQVPGTQPGMYMQVPSTLQQFQHQQ